MLAINQSPSTATATNGRLWFRAALLALLGSLALAGSARAAEPGGGSRPAETVTEQAPETDPSPPAAEAAPVSEPAPEVAPSEPVGELPAESPPAEPVVEPAPETPPAEPAPETPPAEPVPETPPAAEAPPAEPVVERAPEAPPVEVISEHGSRGAGSEASSSAPTQPPAASAAATPVEGASSAATETDGALIDALPPNLTAIDAGETPPSAGGALVSIIAFAGQTPAQLDAVLSCQLSGSASATNQDCSTNLASAPGLLDSAPLGFATAAPAGGAPEGNGDGGDGGVSHPSGPPPGPAPSGAFGGSAAGGTGVSLSGFITRAGMLRLAAPRSMRRLRLSARPWLTAFFVLIPERPG